MNFELTNTTEKANLIKSHLNELYVNGVKSISIKEVKETRSVQANRLYWQWLKVISNHTGDNSNSLHELFKERFLGKKVVETSIGIIEATESTSNLPVKEFYTYMLKVEVLANEFLNIRLPQPSDEFLNYINK